ncbi:MAG: hypothetical protein IT195_10995 [Microthrixaceae bacterium]|nr:hypothetical protein [Microthrixaceae bacterium]
MGGSSQRLDAPAGLATVIGARPPTAADSLPMLPSAPPVVLDGGRLDPASLESLAERDGTLVPFLRKLRGRDNPIVMSLTGPVTVDLDLRRRGLGVEDAARVAREAVSTVASRLLELAGVFVPGAPVLLFLQEPALTNSMHPTFPLAAAEIEHLVADVVDEVGAEADGEVVLGVQVDGRADWSMLFRTGIGALAAPITAHLDSAVAELSRFLESGGIMAWGAVPVDEPLGASVERLWRRLSELWCDLSSGGIDPLLLRERSIITPAASIGNFGISQAERILSLTEELATRVLHQTLGVRLSIGA